ncbi:MAG: hypothetical protein AseanaTS_09170 [Candidatus Pelagadaptatus aseana]|uniref:hypothetical protein n=1 Tax=Candidatus Pelagadaptatus aseana TaxID=3120508 RepID=UPI0039B21B0E
MVLNPVIILLPLVLLVGCQSMPQGGSGVEVFEADDAGQQPARARGAEAMPVTDDWQRGNNSAVTGLADAAEQHLLEQQWWSAVDLAERGIRIEPEEPRLYVILVKAYQGLGKPLLAQQFARQGIRFCSAQSDSCGFLRHNLTDN